DSGAAADAATFLRFVCYQSGDTTRPQSVSALKARLDQLDKEFGLKGNRLFYLAVAPNLVQSIIKNLDAAGMLEQAEGSWVRVVFEKPFGHDLQSARELNAALRKVLHEDQI